MELPAWRSRTEWLGARATLGPPDTLSPYGRAAGTGRSLLREALITGARVEFLFPKNGEKNEGNAVRLTREAHANLKSQTVENGVEAQFCRFLCSSSGCLAKPAKRIAS